MKTVTGLRIAIIIAIIIFFGATIALAIDMYSPWIKFISHSPEYLPKVSVLMVAASVLITFLLALISTLSIEENKKLRKESVRRENNDRKERWLNEIIEWILDSEKNTFKTTSRRQLWNEYTRTFAHLTAITTIINKAFNSELETEFTELLNAVYENMVVFAYTLIDGEIEQEELEALEGKIYKDLKEKLMVEIDKYGGRISELLKLKVKKQSSKVRVFIEKATIAKSELLNK